jgi:hypothetical protein
VIAENFHLSVKNIAYNYFYADREKSCSHTSLPNHLMHPWTEEKFLEEKASSGEEGLGSTQR